jgi:hypothetical protein
VPRREKAESLPVARCDSPVASPQSPVPGPQCPVPSARSPVPGPQCPVPSARSPVPGPRSPVPSARSPVSGPRSPVPSPRSPVPSRQGLASAASRHVYPVWLIAVRSDRTDVALVRLQPYRCDIGTAGRVVLRPVEVLKGLVRNRLQGADTDINTDAGDRLPVKAAVQLARRLGWAGRVRLPAARLPGLTSSPLA